MWIKEHFITVEPISDSSVKGIYKSILSMLKSCKLELTKYRGQEYDNEANMNGEYKGVQARILQANFWAFFMSCGCHLLKLVVQIMFLILLSQTTSLKWFNEFICCPLHVWIVGIFKKNTLYLYLLSHYMRLNGNVE